MTPLDYKKLKAKTNRATPNKHKEDDLEDLVAKYLQKAYPSIIYQFSLGAGKKTSKQQAIRQKRLHGKWSRGFTDLVIYKGNSEHNGLCIELKADGKSPYKLNGDLKKNEHLEVQNNFHKLLKDEGFKACFCVGFKETKEVIDKYVTTK